MPGLFDDLALPADLSAKFYPTRPGTGRRIADEAGEMCWIELLGWNSRAAQDHRFAREEKLRRTGRLPSPQEDYDDLGEMLARLTVGWQLVAPTGQRIDAVCDFTTARSLWNNPDLRWLRTQAVAFLDAEGNFIPPGWRS